MSELATATAASRPCELYAYHSPRPSRTQGHHRFPVFLQNRVFGKIVVPDLLWVCGLCHDSLHELISWILEEGRQPNPMPGRNAQQEARRSVALYQEALANHATVGP